MLPLGSRAVSNEGLDDRNDEFEMITEGTSTFVVCTDTMVVGTG